MYRNIIYIIIYLIYNMFFHEKNFTDLISVANLKKMKKKTKIEIDLNR